MKVIVGLGNPGREYEKTRHNLGFRVVEEWAVANHITISFQKSRFEALVAEVSRDGREEKVLLVKPTTFMNLSGKSVGALVRFYKIAISDVLVVYDDCDYPLGKVRFAASGSSGGHKGVASIIENLGSEDFPRLRLGIGRSEKEDTSSYVLKPFLSSEEKTVKEVVVKAVFALTTWLDEGLDKAMNQFNRNETLLPENNLGVKTHKEKK
ncbi:MAG: aminoacyl-tRNA hydrolase [Deltaproteobacteria bacterium RIFCSPLOWO2_12_FULL_40_28]|nr:MAG: aminoacyl-tRNA hydrolase [Deltaproteobacteria bacterium RIFCSPHIGHO2_02_FULL_40_28]OGQ19336.1 MAG: aminoacyl-tRNA hydrolase [Deltaproteobacteria bacterium RIFCSPHIGHO2_12_FULL_40_32]OGQ40440.1 MAG: aminoacyl-tRNA hydrolase [Deltaproteobacteria bacterium RIFCSPLOWO2_02_FULL_40_36]OGQ53676.1 MAG: aminoacyl-tRNA hydrolase [Deltaproteobacteria bacterium RIFCSPLOWO2_12_FULL_40_28]